MANEKRGGRAPSDDPPGKVNPTLSAETIKCLEFLARMGRYGKTKTEVAGYLIIRGIDDLTRAGTLPLSLSPTQAD